MRRPIRMNSSLTLRIPPSLWRPRLKSTRLSPAKPRVRELRPPTVRQPRPTTRMLKTRCRRASTRKRRVCGKSSLSSWQCWLNLSLRKASPNRQTGGHGTHSSLTGGNVLTLFLSLTYDPAPINFRLSPPHQRKSLGAKNTACRRQRDCSEHGPAHPHRCRL